jgi:hypothetical protein
MDDRSGHNRVGEIEALEIRVGEVIDRGYSVVIRLFGCDFD